jgi:hypothetical protein
MANENEKSIKFRAPDRAVGSAAAIETTRRGSASVAFEPVEEDDAAAAEIEATFRLKLVGLRRLPRNQRPYALRAAREWRLLALKALREKRARDRHARHLFWQLQLPAPRQPG